MSRKQHSLKLYSLTVIALLFPLIFFAQSSLQKQQLIKVTQELITTYNTSDTIQYQKFLGKSITNKKRVNEIVQQFNREHASLGDIETRRIKIVSSTETQALVKALKYEGWWRVVVITDSFQAFKEHHMGIVRVTDEVLDSGTLTNTQISNQIDDYIKRQSKYEAFKGNVFIEGTGKVIYSKSWGSNLTGKPNTFEQQFSLASMGKLFTAISILKLVDEGKLTLEDKVGKLLPQLQNKKLSDITVHQLLTHTSGMGDFFEDPMFQKKMDSAKSSFTQVINTELSDANTFLPFIEKDSLLFKPGTNWSYSNTGFELLAAILEKISGVSYKKYIRERIFKTAGMINSLPGTGSGGGLSTVSDLSRFSKALRNYLFLSQPLTAKFLNYKENDFYGYGSEHQTLGGEHIVGHSGGFENVCNELNIYLHSGYTVIILSNGNPPFGHFLSDEIKQLLIREK